MRFLSASFVTLLRHTKVTSDVNLSTSEEIEPMRLQLALNVRNLEEAVLIKIMHAIGGQIPTILAIEG